MTKSKLIPLSSFLLSSLAILVITAAMSASASAAGCAAKTGSWCIGVLLAGELILTASVQLRATATTVQKLSLPTISTTINCKKLEKPSGNLLLEVENEPILGDEITIQFLECSTEGEASCKVSGGGGAVGTIITNKLDSNISLVNGKNSWKYLPEGTLFVEITVAGCLKAAKMPVSGSQNCNAFDAEETLLEHKVECLKSGSELKDGAKEASYEGTSSESLAGENAGDSVAFVENLF